MFHAIPFIATIIHPTIQSPLIQPTIQSPPPEQPSIQSPPPEHSEMLDEERRELKYFYPSFMSAVDWSEDHVDDTIPNLSA